MSEHVLKMVYEYVCVKGVGVRISVILFTKIIKRDRLELTAIAIIAILASKFVPCDWDDPRNYQPKKD
jgi:hypothetical protein